LVASKGQTGGFEQLNIAVSQMDAVTQQNAVNAEESASSAENMYMQADGLKGVAQQLKSLVGEGEKARRTKAVKKNRGFI
jgi:methyl-accepting chemotaxis protein